MSKAKDELTKLIEEQPEDSSREEIIRELAFHAMVQRGLVDSDAGRVISNDEMSHPLMAEITWTTEAQRWLEDIFECIAADNPGAATQTVNGIYERAQIT